MSDFNQHPVPEVPPPPVPQAPFGATGAPPPPVGYSPPGYAPPGYTPFAGATGQKPPRPAVPVGSALLVVGGALLIAGSFLNWFTVRGAKYTGFSGSGSDTKDGPVFVFLGVLALGFGIAQLLARKVLAVAILAVVFAAFALLAAIADIGDVGDAIKFADAVGVSASRGPGLWIVLLGSLVALGGGIATLSKRRK